jgi:hypothetical protein
MDLASLQSLITSLLLNISALSGYPIPDRLPAVHMVPAAEIQQRVCSKPCGVRAFFAPGEGVFVDAALDLKGAMYDQSILVHELVHALQHANGRYSSEKDCDRFEAEEVEAYDVQNKFLSQTEDPRRFAFLAPPGTCIDAPPQSGPVAR